MALCACAVHGSDPASEQFARAPFGTVRLYRPHGPARHLALLISGDGGWGAAMGSIAQDLAGADTLVAGIDGAGFLHGLASGGECASPAQALAGLGRFLIAREHLPPGTGMTLLGHSAGATLAYVALAQSAPGTFTGAVTLSFCTELDLTRPLCPAPGLRGTTRASGIVLQPGRALPGPWLALHGQDDRVCPAAEGQAFAAAIPQARFTAIPGVDHNYRNRAAWWPAFTGAFRRLAGDGAAPAP
jgi:type IV secretory pathway VirJ component